jgi:hypothetical protein
MKKLNLTASANGKETAKTDVNTPTDKQTVVNFYGGPGAGKSTTSAAVFALLKLHNIESELVTEFAKDLVWEERAKTFRNQFYLYGKQQHRLWRVSGKVKVIVTDAPLLHNNIYGIIYEREGSQKFYDYIFDEINQYNNINFFIERVKPYMAYGRNEKEDKARYIDNFIKDYLTEHGFDYISIPGNTEGINIAVDKIFELLCLEERKYGIK